MAGPWRRRRAASRPCPALCLGLTLSDTDHQRGRADRRLLARTTAAAAAAAEHADPRWLDPPAWPSGDHAARPATQRTGRGAGGRWRRKRDGLTGCHNNSCAKPWPPRTLAHRAAPRPHPRPRSAKVRMRGAPGRWAWLAVTTLTTAGLILSNRSGANCVNLGSAGQRRWAAGAPTGAALAAAAYPFAVAFAARFAPLRPHRRVRSWTRVLAWVARSRGAPTPRARSSVKNKAKRSRSSRSWRSCCWTRSLSTAAALRLVGCSHQAPWGAVSPPLPP